MRRRSRLREMLFYLLPSAFCLLPSSVFANDLSVDPRTLQLNDLTTITVSLEGAFASADSVNVPLDNLAFVGEPWVSSEFAWINGDVVRRKIFRFRARPLLAGPARVGPVVLSSGDGQRDTLPAIAVQIMPDRIAGTNDPEALLRELTATGRPPLFLVVEAGKQDAWIGEQVVVTWYLYNAATVENWQVVSLPKLNDFWTEELETRSQEAERVWVGDRQMQRVRLRRVALYPLTSGTLQIGPMSVEAEVMERLRGPFSIFEGNLVETTFSSAPVTVNVRPLPPGPPIDAVGELTLTCESARQRNRGPVVLGVALQGSGNLRSATPPRFAGPIGGEVQIEGGQTDVVRDEGTVTMTRRWRYLIFPAKEGALAIPPLTMTVFSPATGRRMLRCEQQTFWNAAAAAPGQQRSPRPDSEPAQRNRAKTPAILAALLALVALVSVPFVRKELALRRAIREILGSNDIRAQIDARFGSDLMNEQSDRGDAYRSLRSLLDTLDRGRHPGIDAKRELRRRLREILM